MKEYTKGVAETRLNFSEFLDNAAYAPGYIRRRREHFTVISSELFEDALPYIFKITFGYDDINGRREYFTKNDLIPDIMGWGETKESAVASFVEGLHSICQDFRENYQSYRVAPNLKEQVPVLLKVSSILARRGDLWDIIEIGEE